MRSLNLLGAIVLGFLAAAIAPAIPAISAPLRDGFTAVETGLIFKDPATNVIIYVETDGRHVVAISPDGKLLWRKNPFVDAGLKPYRQARPIIDEIGAASDRVLPDGSRTAVFGLRFTSSQGGEMEIATGHFWFGGQD